MLRFLVRRLAMLVVTLLVSSFVIYARCTWRRATRSPRSPAAARRRREAIAVLEQRYHLDEPFFVPLLAVAEGGALHGDLGVSIPLREDVSDLIAGADRGRPLELVAVRVV